MEDDPSGARRSLSVGKETRVITEYVSPLVFVKDWTSQLNLILVSLSVCL